MNVWTRVKRKAPKTLNPTVVQTGRMKTDKNSFLTKQLRKLQSPTAAIVVGGEKDGQSSKLTTILTHLLCLSLTQILHRNDEILVFR